MAFEIRFATRDDAESVLNITREAFALYKERAGASEVDALKETREDVIYDIENKLVFIAVDGDKTEGCVRVEIKDDNTALLTRFAVRVNSHNNGIGKRLINRIDEVMQKNGVTSIALYTASAVESLMGFYGSCGFKVESSDTKRGYLRSRLVKEYI